MEGDSSVDVNGVDTATMAERPVPLAALAAETGFSPAGFHRALRRRGINPYQLKQVRNAPYYVSADDAEAFRRAINDERRYVVKPSEQPLTQSIGGVYCVEVPSYDGRVRVKIGWADKIEERLSTYRTIVPDLRVVAIWPTREQWMERGALLRAAQIGVRVFTELFEFQDNTAAVSELREWFADLGVQSVQEDTILEQEARFAAEARTGE